jgi:hypothetical protein
LTRRTQPASFAIFYAKISFQILWIFSKVFLKKLRQTILLDFL